MPKFNVELVRRFFVSDMVVVEAQDENEAEEKAYKNFDTLKSKLPQFVYEWVEFEDTEVLVEGEASPSDIEEYEKELLSTEE